MVKTIITSSRICCCLTNKAICVDRHVVFAQLRLRLFAAGWYDGYWLVDRLKLFVKFVTD